VPEVLVCPKCGSTDLRQTAFKGEKDSREGFICPGCNSSVEPLRVSSEEAARLFNESRLKKMGFGQKSPFVQQNYVFASSDLWLLEVVFVLIVLFLLAPFLVPFYPAAQRLQELSWLFIASIALLSTFLFYRIASRPSA